MFDSNFIILYFTKKKLKLKCKDIIYNMNNKNNDSINSYIYILFF